MKISKNFTKIIFNRRRLSNLLRIINICRFRAGSGGFARVHDREHFNFGAL